MISGILAALSLIKEIIDGIKGIAKFIEDNRNEKWFQDSAQIFIQLRGAKNDDERKKILQDLAGAWRGIGH